MTKRYLATELVRQFEVMMATVTMVLFRIKLAVELFGLGKYDKILLTSCTSFSLFFTSFDFGVYKLEHEDHKGRYCL